jgi:tight adherence protein B
MAETGALDPVASVVQRLGVLLAAGVAPASAWGYLAESLGGGAPQDAAGIVAAVAARARTEPIAEAILAAVPVESASTRRGRRIPTGAAWCGLAAAWFVASDAGAPLAPSLQEFAGSLRDLAETQRDVEVALAGPAATAKFVTVLPVVGILFGLGLGVDTHGVLFGTVPGALCLAAGVALVLAARAWNRRLLRAARPKELTPGLPLELLSIAVSGGASLDRARRAVAAALDRCGLEESPGQLDEVLELSRRAGVPAGLLLRSEAEQSRRIARSSARQKAAALSVTLMLPLGVCVLPAFLLLGVAPLMIAVISSTAGSF